MAEFIVSVLSNIVSAALISLFAVLLWPSRREVLAFLRQWITVRNVNLYLSETGEAWNIEVPFRYVGDVQWRLRAFGIRDSAFASSSTSDEYSRAFRLCIAGYDGPYEDDVPLILDALKRGRIRLAPDSQWGGAKDSMGSRS